MSSRYILLPIPDEQLPIWDLYKLQQHLYWVPEEVTLADDKRQWATLSEKERRFLSRILAFFAAADLLICENIEMNFEREVQWNSAKAFYKGQDAMEMIHAEVYANLLNTLVAADERDRLIRGFEALHSVRQKHQWVKTFMDPSRRTFEERLVAFCVFEGLLFSASFAAIYFFKHERKGVLPGLCHANELISRDEGLHAQFAALLYRRYVSAGTGLVATPVRRLTDAQVHKIFDDAVEVERAFIRDAIPVAMLGMNAALMERYVEFVANKLLRTLGHSELYASVTNPFPWMVSTAIPGQTNFFERKVAEYAKPRRGSAFTNVSDFSNMEF